ncbi:MAG: hypothetical protein N3F04_07220 [Candidatus Nezhaarchaeota archaeon]|nr:hypothetical protein [Candidatus Nezhaarchaeota archaeon]
MKGYLTIAPIVVLLATSIALATVFVYYPLEITVQPTAPGVKFWNGSNAGNPDIGPYRITVTLGLNNTSASIVIHPTYQENYYKDILQVRNYDDDAMYVYFIIKEHNLSDPINNVTIFIYNITTTPTLVNTTKIVSSQKNQPIYVGQIGSNQLWSIDFYVNVTEASSINGLFNIELHLVYTPVNETPPVTPSTGR